MPGRLPKRVHGHLWPNRRYSQSSLDSTVLRQRPNDRKTMLGNDFLSLVQILAAALAVSPLHRRDAGATAPQPLNGGASRLPLPQSYRWSIRVTPQSIGTAFKSVDAFCHTHSLSRGYLGGLKSSGLRIAVPAGAFGGGVALSRVLAGMVAVNWRPDLTHRRSRNPLICLSPVHQ
jgi:hypothetical protein